MENGNAASVIDLSPDGALSLRNRPTRTDKSALRYRSMQSLLRHRSNQHIHQDLLKVKRSVILHQVHFVENGKPGYMGAFSG
ncbi:hypothetical protein NDA00_28820 [Funiculus sociatus GB2-M2]